MDSARVLYVITQLELGGAQLTTLELLRRLNRRRYQLTLVTSPGGALEAEARAIPGLDVWALPSLARPVHPWRDAQAYRELTRFIRHCRFDLVHTHSSKAGILGRWAAHRAGVPVICHTIHGFGFHAGQPGWVRRSFQAVERATARITTRLIAVNRHDERVGLSAGIGRPEQYQRIPYGIDPSRFHPNGLTPQGARAQLGLQPDAPTIGTVACFKPQKAPEDFLAVCARLRERVPNLQAVMVGDGALRPQIERRRRALGLESVVHLLGWRREIPEILTALDVFVLTSRWEGLPVSVLEAQAMGVPVVVTDTGGVRDCLKHGVDGWMVPVGAVEAFSDGVARLLRDPVTARRMAEEAQRRVRQQAGVERMVRETEALYETVLRGRHTGGADE